MMKEAMAKVETELQVSMDRSIRADRIPFHSWI